jgi:sugar/nucleoside kinase (ribokinase family)
MAARLRIAAVGEVGIDRYVDRDLETLGGCSCNFARAAAAAGASASLFAAVGDDARGRQVRAALSTTPLELEHVRTEHGATALQHIRVAPDGERQFCGWEPGVVAAYTPTPAELAALAAYDVIALADTPAWAPCLAIVGPKRVADFSKDADTAWQLAGLDIAFVGGVPDDLERLRALVTDDTLVVLTAGAAGAWALARDRVLHQPSLATTIVDTTGCGDAFQGAFTAVYFAGATLEEALVVASRAAASAALRCGA